MGGIRNLFQRRASIVFGALLIVCLIATATSVPARTHHANRDKDATRHPSSVARVVPGTLHRYSKGASHHAASIDPKALSPETAQIAREVRHELMLLPYYSVFDWLEFQVNPDGTVILRGEVVSPPDTRSRAEAAAKSVDGVKKVVNDIEVLPVSANDQRLRRRIYHRLFNWDSPLFRYAVGSFHPIHIIVKNGRLTLKGEVDSSMDKQLAYSRASSVPGLFAVENQLEVTNQKPR